MAILQVLKYPDKRLRIVAEPVTEFNEELKTKVNDMHDTVYSQNGGGIAGTQVNYHKRLFTFAGPFVTLKEVYINPEILESHGTIISVEGCLSFPGVKAKVKRAQRIKVRYQDIDGGTHEEYLAAEPYTNDKGETVSVDDYEAFKCRCFQHEIDHLNGIVFIDHFSKLKQKILLQKLSVK